MKKLFRNLMLVAVAAMAFVACSEVSVEVDNIKRNYVFDVNAGINNDTRAYFGEAKDGIYPIYWDGTESVRFEAQGDYGDGTTGPYGTMSNKMTISDDATRAMFKIEFYDVSVLVPGTIDAYVGAIDFFGNLTISGNTQTPSVDSIDKEYFALKAEFPYDGKTTTLVGDFVHLSAYSKMTVEGFDDVELDNVAVIADDNRYDLNVKDLDTKTYWFAAVPDANVNNLTIEATTVDGVLYTKTYTLADGKLAFNAGRISNFTAKGFEKYVAPAFTSENTMSYDSSSENYVDEVISYSDVLMIFSSEELGTLQLNFDSAFDGNFITPGTFYVGYHIYNNYDTDYSYYKPAGSETAYKLDGGSVIVSVTEDKKYHFEFKDITYNEGNTLNATYTGDIDGFGMPDTREKLPVPEVNTPTVNGKEITLTWSAVNGADGYYVYCTQDNTINTTTTELTATFTMPEYETVYFFNIKAIANDDNPYRSSDETNFTTVETGSDPDKFEADYVMDSLEWNSSVYGKGGAFQMKGACLKYPTQDYVAFYLNSADHTENSIKPGVYASYSDYTPASGQFAGLLSLNWGDYTRPTSFDSTCSLTVRFANDVYTVILNYKGTTYGYKGMPEGWKAPEFGGEEPGEPEPTTVNVSLNSIEHYYYNSAYWYHEFQFSDGSNANVLRAAFDMTYCSEASINAGTYTHKGLSNLYPDPSYNITYLCIDGQVISGFNAGDMTITVDGNNYTISVQITSGTTTYNVSLNGTFGTSTGGDTEPITPLTTPSNLKVTYNGTSATITWDAVDGADYYGVTYGSTTNNTSTNSVTLEGLSYNTDYTVNVVAYPSDTTSHTSSEAASIIINIGDEPTTDFIDWNFTAHYDTGTKVVTLTGKDDSRVITVKTNSLGFKKFYADTAQSNYFTDATVDGVATSDVTAESYVDIQMSQVSINLVINGITYTGNSASFSY